MSVPDYQSFMLPLLEYAADGQVHTTAESRAHLVDRFALTPEDLAEQLPSGKQAVFNNRVGWATTYLRQAGLLESVSRGSFRITTVGKQALGSKPAAIDVKFLERYPAFQTFRSSHHTPTPKPGCPTPGDEQTPEEQIEVAYQSWRTGIASELGQRLRSCSPGFFEQLVLDLLLAMGYGGSRREAAAAVGRSGDGGIDGIINEDKLGLDVVYVQAKRWEGSVSSPIVSGFVGALVGRKASKGVLITTSSFTQPALDFAKAVSMKVVLIDGARLADLMVEHGIGVTDTATYTLKRIDEDYFEA